MINRIILLFVWVFSAYSPTSWAISNAWSPGIDSRTKFEMMKDFEVTAELDRTPIFFDESVNLIITATGTVPVDDAPDLTSLRKNFEILGQTSQTSIFVTNGVHQFRHSWIIEIKPLQLGITHIPAISIQSKRTLPIDLEVKHFSGNVLTVGDEIYLETQIEPENPYVQSQVTFTVRLYISNDVAVPEGSVSDPTLEHSQIEKIGQDRRYGMQLANLDYRVIEKRFAIFPEHSGDMEISAVEFNGVVGRNGKDGMKYTRERISSNPTEFSVRPKPITFSGTTWLPARNLELKDSWENNLPNFQLNTPETRKISIQAEGLRALQLPSLTFEENSSTRIYRNAPELKTKQSSAWILGERLEEYVVMPQRADNVVVPEFKIVWWDVDEDREKVASLPSISSLGIPSLSLDDGVFGTEDEPLSQQNLNQFVESGSQQIWKWLSFGLLILWLLTILIWYYNRGRVNAQNQFESADRERRTQRKKKLLRELRLACKDCSAETASAVLLDWAQQQWTHSPPRNLPEIGRRLQSESLTTQLRSLDQIRYSNQLETWDGESLWLSFQRAWTRANQKSRRKQKFYLWRKSENTLENLWPESELL